MSDDSENSGRKTGRPRKTEGPRVPYDEVDQLLVFGEVVHGDDGATSIAYPSYRELAGRYGCAHSLIAQYSRKHNCLRRRKETKARVAVKAEQKLVEMRATAMALSKDDALRMIDTYLVGFEQALSEGRVRYDNPTDFNTMLRLKEFILGGADSRQEIHAALSLEDIQARHQRMLRASQQASLEECGDVSGRLPLDQPEETDHDLPENSPAPPAEAAAGEVPGQRGGAAEIGPAARGPTARPSVAAARAADNQASVGGSAPHGANVAPTGPSVGPPLLVTSPSAPAAARDIVGPGAESPEKVCAPSSPSSASLLGDGDDGRAGAGTSRSSAALRPPAEADADRARAPVAASRVLPAPCGEGVGEGSQAPGEHAPDQDGAS